MKQKLIFPAALITLLASSLCRAQTYGYVTGTPAGQASLSSFNASTGAIVNSFIPSYGEGTTFAVAADDTTLYIPGAGPHAASGFVDVVSGQTGQLLNSLELGYRASKAVLSSDGSTLYVLTSKPEVGERVVVVDTSALTVSGTIAFAGELGVTDIALSPDNSTLYASVVCDLTGGQCSAPQTICPITEGICIFDASTLALKGTLTTVVPYFLSLSRDGSSLYAVSHFGNVYIVNTTTLAVTVMHLTFEVFGPVVIDPVGHWALVLSQTTQNSTAAYLLNTSTNKLAAELFASAPGNAQVQGPGAFSPDGKSAWMIVACDQNQPETCSFPNNGGRGLVGVSLPSGVVIAETDLAEDASNIAFPR